MSSTPWIAPPDTEHPYWFSADYDDSEILAVVRALTELFFVPRLSLNEVNRLMWELEPVDEN